MKVEKRIILLVGLFILGISATSLATVYIRVPTDKTTTQSETILTASEFKQLAGQTEQLKLRYQPDRKSYGYGTFTKTIVNKACFQKYRKDAKQLSQCIQGRENYKYKIKDIIEQNLPPLPDDFFYYKAKLMKTGYLDLCDLNESYWKQPEFYRDSFVEVGLSGYKNPNPNYWYPTGRGVFPSTQFVGEDGSLHPGDEITLCTTLRSGWWVETQQGYRIIPTALSNFYYEPESKNYKVASSEETNKYIKVEISPDVVVTTESYPVFSYNWTQLITVKIKISPDTPPGTYAVGFTLVNPDIKTMQQLSQKYPMYMPMGLIDISQPYFKVYLKVTK